jgi:hypothetical protein
MMMMMMMNPMVMVCADEEIRVTRECVCEREKIEVFESECVWI